MLGTKNACMSRRRQQQQPPPSLPPPPHTTATTVQVYAANDPCPPTCVARTPPPLSRDRPGRGTAKAGQTSGLALACTRRRTSWRNTLNDTPILFARKGLSSLVGHPPYPTPPPSEVPTSVSRASGAVPAEISFPVPRAVELTTCLTLDKRRSLVNY